MKTLTVVLLMCVSFFFLPVAMADESSGPRPIKDVEVSTPKGDYAVVTLRFDVPKAPAETLRRWQYVGALRDRRLTIAHDHRLREPCGVLTLKDGKLAGTFTRSEGRRGTFAIGKVTVDEPLHGKPEGWAAGIVYALANRDRRACGVPWMLNAEVEEFFGVTMSTAYSRAAEVERALEI